MDYESVSALKEIFLNSFNLKKYSDLSNNTYKIKQSKVKEMYEDCQFFIDLIVYLVDYGRLRRFVKIFVC
jgi:hypothetical protein